MARLSNRQDNASTVVFGVSLGHQFSPQWGAEAGLSVSSYLIGSAGARYYIPFMEKVVKLSLGFDLASVLGTVSQNSTFNSDPKFSYSPNIRAGSILAGPGVFFDIPLLGAALRGDLRFYTGSSTVLVGTYGFIYYL
jgi:outer membrane protein assembly factor BamA